VAPGWGAAAILSGCTLLSGCTQLVPRDRQQFKVEDQDFAIIADASLKLVERTRPVITFVVPPAADARARAALKKLRAVARPEDVPKATDYVLPEGYFIVERFDIEDGAANFEGELGPVTRAAEGKNLPGCGLRFSMAFYWEAKGWASHSYKILDCAKTRMWTPVD
jgi:hypothetical protein